MNLSLRCAVLALALVVLAPGVVLADSLLILPLGGNATQRSAARDAIRVRLRHMGEAPTTPTLSDADGACRNGPCLGQLASRFHASRLLGGEVTNNDGNYLIKLWLLEVASQDLRAAQGSCEDCRDADLLTAVATTAGHLLERPTVASAAPTVTPTPTPAPAAAVSAVGATPRPAPAWRKPTAIALGGVAAVTLATAIALSIKNGAASGPCERDGLVFDSCHKNYTAGAAVSYTAAGLSTVAMILVLTLPTSRLDGSR